MYCEHGCVCVCVRERERERERDRENFISFLLFTRLSQGTLEAFVDFI